MRRQPKPTVNRGPKDSEPSMPKLGKRKHPMPAVAETVGDSDDSSSSSSSSSSSESSSDSSDSDSGKTSSLSDNSTRRRRRYRSRRKRYYKSTRRSKSRSKMKKNKHGEENLALTPVRAVKHEPDLDPTEFAIWSPVQSRAVQSLLESGNKSRSASLVKEKKPITPNKAKKKPELEKPAATTSTKPKETKSKDKDRESRSSTSFRGKHSPIRNPKKLVSPLRSAVITIDKSQPYTTPRPKDNNNNKDKDKDKENDKDKSQRSKRHYTDNMSKKKRSSSRSSSRSRDGRSKKTREMLLRAVTVTRDSPGSRRRSPVSFNSNRSKDTRSIMRSPSKLRNMRSSSRTADNRGRRDRRSVSRSNLRITFENRRSRSRSANSSPARYRLFSPEPVNNLRLHIRGLTRQVTKLDIIDIFSHYGPLTNVDFPMERFHGNGFNRYGRGFAFVQFENADDCEMARKNMDGGRVDGKTISVTPFDKNLLRYPMRRRFDSPTRDRCFN